jgi:hypothetical protein
MSLIRLIVAAVLAAAQPAVAAENPAPRTNVGLFSRPAAAKAAVTVKPGEAVTVKLEDAGGGRLKATVLDRGPAAGAGEEKPAPDTVRFIFAQSELGLTLNVQNGYAATLDYHATMTLGRREIPTSVCIVLPNGQGFEMWSDPILEIALSDFTLSNEMPEALVCD